MTPAEHNNLNEKLDKVFGVLRDVQVKLAQLTSGFDAHEKQHVEHQKYRHETCPNAEAVRSLLSSVDAIAGIQREHHARLVKLEQWSVDTKHEDDVDEAERRLKSTPLLWVWKNADRLIWIVVAAWILLKLGL